MQGLAARTQMDPEEPGWVSHECTLRRRLSELAQTLPGDLNWIHALTDAPTQPGDTREIETHIGDGQTEAHYRSGSWLRFSNMYSPAVPLHQRQRRVLALITFEGHKNMLVLATKDRPYQAILELLDFLQPVYAWVTNDWEDPSEPQFIAKALRYPHTSAFFGPELTRRIPAHLLNPTNGFSHIERIRKSIWITVEGESGYLWDFLQSEEFQRHCAACDRVTDFLKLVPGDMS